ncbi:MAG: CPBP family intramembrane metalloprotease [Alcanivoracaceae bacterium]|nr:CPBP family intramembrane metalloprotease [Alcanivoracaceae bacterium]
MIDIRKYFYPFSIVFALLFLTWFVALQLTKQRIQLEAENKFSNFESKQTPFVWDFKLYSRDIVQPYQKFWQELAGSNQIKAIKGQNPQLSLNFSGEVINSLYHPVLQIKSPSELHGSLKIQFKTELDDDYFYYSDTIELSGKELRIDLVQNWEGRNSQTNKVVNVGWGASMQKISSLVLYFNNPDQDLLITSISMPYGHNYPGKEMVYEVNCQGEIQNSSLLDQVHLKVFKLKTPCFLPSNYLWLNKNMQNRYPESIFFIDDINLWQQVGSHKVNNFYTNILTLNLILYLYAMFVIVVAAIVTKRYSVSAAKQYNKVPRFHSLLLSYAFILIPSLIILSLLMFYKLADSTTFKLLPMYFVWALFQQFILGYILAERIFYQRIQNRIISSVLAALVFSILHMPSVTLMLVTFVAGIFWAYSWLFFKRLIPLALSHSVLALMFYYLISERFLYSAKIFQWFWM